jgi:predicted MFS family arabinose efflux permease
VSDAGPRGTRGLMVLLTVFMFATAGTIHFQTPMLPELAREFGATAAEVGWVPTLSFAGFLSGTLFVSPLGDSFDKRRLILAKLVCLTAAMAAMGAAPSLGLLVAAGFAAGVGASLSQDVVPLVAELAPPGERGRAVGTVLSGLFLGILFGRIGGGFVTEALGWRWMYAISAAMLVAMFAGMSARCPSVPPKTRLAYRTLMGSLADLMRKRVDLRRASGVQFLLGTCYGGFWATLALMLAAAHGLGPAAAGLVGIPGAAGILVARPAGRWMDRRGVGPVVTTGIALVMAAYLVFGFGAVAIAAIVAGAVLLDSGLRAAMVANQAFVTGVDAETRSRSNTIFSVHNWAGYATGAFLASLAWSRFGWLGVCAVGVVASAAALALYLAGRR